MVGARPLAALTLALALAACGRPPAPQASTPAPGAVEDAAPPAPPAPGKGYLKLRKIYDYVGDRAGTPWAGFELNGDYNYPEPIFGGWPMLVTPVDASGNPTGPAQEITTLQELSPTDGRYVEVAAGRYKVEERTPTSTFGGGVWSVTGANSSLGDTTTPAGAVTSQFVTVTAGETTVARFLNVCKLNGQPVLFPEQAREDVGGFSWVCTPSFRTPPPPSGGDLDPTFGEGGTVTTDLSGFGDISFRALTFGPGGEIALAGYGDAIDFLAIRLTANGELDTNFGSGGAASADFGGNEDVPEGVAVQADGKIVVGGQSNPSSNFALARFNLDGSLDGGFDGDGRMTTDFGGDDLLFDLAVQADGKVVAVGLSSAGSNTNFALARYNPDGSLDASFSGDGKVVTDFAGDADAAQVVVVQPDGKIVAAGFGGAGGDDFALARYNSDGSLDSSFGSTGRVTTDFLGNEDVVSRLALQPDGKIVALGRTNDFDAAYARYNPDGSLDPSFGTGGRLIASYADPNAVLAANVVVQADGKLVVTGVTGTTNGRSVLARYNPDGTLDTGFGASGLVFTTFSAGLLRLQADGKIVVAGFCCNGDGFTVARYLP